MSTLKKQNKFDKDLEGKLKDAILAYKDIFKKENA